MTLWINKQRLLTLIALFVLVDANEASFKEESELASQAYIPVGAVGMIVTAALEDVMASFMPITDQAWNTLLPS